MAGAPLLGPQQHIDQLKGKYIFVQYDIPGEDLWHQRLALSHVTGGEWVILTPDGDLYSEDLGSGSQDISAWRLGEPFGSFPFGVDPNRTHCFNPAPDPGAMPRLLQEGDVYAAHERLQRGLPLQPVAAAPAVVPAADAVVAAGPPNLAGGGAGGGAVGAAPAAIGGGGNVAPALAGGVLGNANPGAGASGLGLGLGGMDIDQEDARTLGITRDASGNRFKEFRLASLECKEISFNDWPVAGPRTVLYVLSKIVEHGGSPIAHSQAWRTACKLQPSDKPAQDHEMLCRILQTMVVYDQLDVANIAAAELVVRGIQRIEEQHKMKLVAAEDAGEASLFLGSSGGSRVGTVISPKLSEWIGAEMQKEASIAKERRKAREERALSRKADKAEKEK